MHKPSLRDVSIGLVRQDHLLYGFILAYTACAIVIGIDTDLPVSGIFAHYFMPWCVTFGLVFPSLYLTWRFRSWRQTRAEPPHIIAHDPRLFLGTLCAGVLLALAMVFFQASFTVVKNALYVWNDGFPLDELHADIDRMLHGGIDPWRFFEPLMASNQILNVMEFNYSILWFQLNFGILFIMLVSPGLSHLRSRYFLAFALTWIVVGNIFAGLFLSAGPVFYGAVTGDSQRFAELVSLLAANKDGSYSAATYQNYLWTMHVSGTSGLGTGISAFPSVHVALTVINMLFAFEIRRSLGIAMTVYTAIILVTSVACGWHYAIDGYASIAICAVLYWALRRIPALNQGVTRLQPATIS
ncbi:MAG TPA: phosphatase PAP2 family protein [Rhizobiaceae bacterium]|nr:phosphatase PAP2 family protein [Rhizobiaceae bacterium]